MGRLPVELKGTVFSLFTGSNIHKIFFPLDSDPKPDIIWPCAAPITCSAVTLCLSYLAFACEDRTVTIWDIFLGEFSPNQ